MLLAVGSIIIVTVLAALELWLLVILLDEWLVLLGYVMRKDRVRPLGTAPVSTRIVFLVAAHNEERVVSGLLASIRQLDWPADSLSTWLVADRCTDRTAQLAKQAGACVWEREPVDETGRARRVGKGHALSELLQQYSGERGQVDVFIILDADVRLSRGYLHPMLAVWNAGYPVVQGASATAAPDESSLSQVNSLANRVQHIVQQGRFQLGLPNLIIGNTLLIDRQVLESLGWQLAKISPTEEEIKIPLVSREVPIGYASQAWVYEESVHNVADLAKQRSRWFRDYVLFLTRAGLPILITSCCRGRWRRAEAALAHFGLTSHTLELLVFTATFGLAGLSGSYWLIVGAAALLLGKLIYLGCLCLAAGLSLAHILRLGWLVPRLAMGWIGGVLLWLARPTRTGWSHTRHQG